MLKLKRPQRVCELSNRNHVLPNLEGSFSLRIKGNLAFLFFVRLVSSIVGRVQQIVYMEIKTEATVQSERYSRRKCAADNVQTITRVGRVSKSEGGVVCRHTQWPLWAIASAAFSLAAFLLWPCRAYSSRRSTPHPVRERLV